ncbi:hypothetical protein DFJ73DRAFT_945153 [Zopfochytrium polystomum]|nr:hypothetical protein DFJ73DRAFT_945153 [Zopfochytrium polystomum]
MPLPPAPPAPPSTPPTPPPLPPPPRPTQPQPSPQQQQQHPPLPATTTPRLRVLGRCALLVAVGCIACAATVAGFALLESALWRAALDSSTSPDTLPSQQQQQRRAAAAATAAASRFIVADSVALCSLAYVGCLVPVGALMIVTIFEQSLSPESESESSEPSSSSTPLKRLSITTTTAAAAAAATTAGPRPAGRRAWFASFAFVHTLYVASYCVLATALAVLVSDRRVVVTLAPLLRAPGVFPIRIVFDNGHGKPIAQFLLESVLDTVLSYISFVFAAAVMTLSAGGHSGSSPVRWSITAALVLLSLAIQEMIAFYLDRAIPKTAARTTAVAPEGEEEEEEAEGDDEAEEVAAPLSESSTLSLLRSAVLSSLQSLAPPTEDRNSAFYRPKDYECIAVVTLLRAPASDDAIFYLFSACRVLYSPTRDLLELAYEAYLQRRRRRLRLRHHQPCPVPTTTTTPTAAAAATTAIRALVRAFAATRHPYLTLHRRISNHIANVSATLIVAVWFVADSQPAVYGPRFPAACADRLAASLKHTLARAAALFAAELATDVAYCGVYAALDAASWRFAARRSSGGGGGAGPRGRRRRRRPRRVGDDHGGGGGGGEADAEIGGDRGFRFAYTDDDDDDPELPLPLTNTAVSSDKKAHHSHPSRPRRAASTDVADAAPAALVPVPAVVAVGIATGACGIACVAGLRGLFGSEECNLLAVAAAAAVGGWGWW